MDKQTLMLELKGLSRVVSNDVRALIHKRRAVEELADSFEPVNPFLNMLDDLEEKLIEHVQLSVFTNLSEDERNAFVAQWSQIHPAEQLRFLDQYVAEDAS